MKVQNSIDHNFIERAEEESYQILLNQHLSFNDRWNSKVRPKLRRLGVLICLIGIVVGLFGIVIVGLEAKNTFCLGPSMILLMLFTLLFIIMWMIFYFSPKSKKSIPNWSKKIVTRSCKKTARLCVKDAKKLAPFEAEYDIDKELISYYRWKDNIRKLAWSRKLNGVAIHGLSVTILFKKWTSVTPLMVILHQNFDAIKPALEHQKIEFKSIAMEYDNKLEHKEKP